MQIPKNTLSASQFRTYGTGGFTLEHHEAEQGCPAKYKAKYVDGVEESGEKPYPLRYGSLFHTVMFLMEEKGLTPDEALEEAFEPDMPQQMWTECRDDLQNYMNRGNAPSDLYGTLAVEQDVKALLYIDEDFGEVYYRGFIDLLGIDLTTPDVVHSVDYKTNRAPVRQDALRGDVQLRGYHWLVMQNWERWLPREPRIITHLDVVKFNDVPIAYTAEEIEDWHSWAVAVARKMLRDEAAEPVLNPGCAYCFVRDTCPAFNALPSIAETLATEGSALKDPAAKLAWRDRAHKVKGLLEKAVKEIDAGFQTEAKKHGELVIGSERFVSGPKFVNSINLRKLHELLGNDRFYQTVSTSKTAIEKNTKDMDMSDRALALATIGRTLDGSSVTRISN